VNLVRPDQEGEEMPEGGDAAGIAAMADTVPSGLFEKVMDDRDVDQFEIGNR
jgi:hypothetical protein